jgi:hypothetical protein
MNNVLLDQIKREVGLAPAEAAPVTQKRASVDSIVEEINEYLASDTLSNVIVQLEKTAGVRVPDEIKTFVSAAEERGTSEDEIINFIFEKKGYRIPKDNDSRHRDLLNKAANYIGEVNERLAVMNDTMELIKVAMDMVQAEHVAPFTSYDDLTEKMSELATEGDPELLKRAAELARKRVPNFGKVANKRGVAMSATDRFLESLIRLNQGE